MVTVFVAFGMNSLLISKVIGNVSVGYTASSSKNVVAPLTPRILRSVTAAVTVA